MKSVFSLALVLVFAASADACGIRAAVAKARASRAASHMAAPVAPTRFQVTSKVTTTATVKAVGGCSGPGCAAPARRGLFGVRP